MRLLWWKRGQPQCRHTSAQSLKSCTKQKPQLCVGHPPAGRCHLLDHKKPVIIKVDACT